MQLGEEAYQAWLNQPPIQFPLHPSSPIRNSYNNNSSSHVGNGGNEVQMLVWEVYYDKGVPWMQCCFIHSRTMS